jgi:hypothetical protein
MAGKGPKLLIAAGEAVAGTEQLPAGIRALIVDMK